MNEILKEHVEIASKTAGTSTVLELLHLELKPENFYAANTYLIALKYIQKLEAKLEQQATA